MIQIKGITDGLLVTLREGSWKEAKNLLLGKIDEKPAFFQGARMAIDLGELSLKSVDLGKIRDQLSERGISLWAVLSKSDLTLKTAQTLGLSVHLRDPKPAEKPQKMNHFFEGDSAVWIERTLRAGYKVETKCHVVVIGDVNPGAEIVSAGNIFVWGRLSGSVHAGADGNINARIISIDLEATNLQIAGVSASPIVKKRKKIPEVACLSGNEIIIQSWDINKKQRGDQ
ncbi:MAG: septum site-determining protein MinC [Anaerolineaceae bacterium]